MEACIVDVNRENLAELWPGILHALRTAEFVGVDCELSGLGSKRNLHLPSIADRYKALCDVARSRALLSLGIACFSRAPSGSAGAAQPASAYTVKIFDLTLFCEDEYVVEPASLRFLDEHGFDFNMQIRKGLPYRRGGDPLPAPAAVTCSETTGVASAAAAVAVCETAEPASAEEPPTAAAVVGEEGAHKDEGGEEGEEAGKAKKEKKSKRSKRKHRKEKSEGAPSESGSAVSAPDVQPKLPSRLLNAEASALEQPSQRKQHVQEALRKNKQQHQPEPPALRQSVTHLFYHILRMQKPLVLHNGLVDLVFLYQCFYGDLPSTLEAFVADWADLSPQLVDTKYVAEYILRENASYLEYLFRKLYRSGGTCEAKSVAPHLEMTFIRFPAQCSTFVRLPRTSNSLLAKEQMESVCKKFAYHGYCSAGPKCSRSHDLDVILDAEAMLQGAKKRKRVKDTPSRAPRIRLDGDGSAPSGGAAADDFADEGEGEGEGEGEREDEGEGDAVTAAPVVAFASSPSTAMSSRAQGHRAGFDAFMTGYVYASALARGGGTPQAHSELCGKIYLAGKPRPLGLLKSKYTSSSPTHSARQAYIRSLFKALD